MAEGHTDVELALPPPLPDHELDRRRLTLRETLAMAAFERTALARVMSDGAGLKMWTLQCVRSADLMMKALDLTPDQVKQRIETFHDPQPAKTAEFAKRIL